MTQMHDSNIAEVPTALVPTGSMVPLPDSRTRLQDLARPLALDHASYHAATSYLTLFGRLRVACSIMRAALSQGYQEMRRDNDLSRIVKVLQGLNDRQLAVLGFERPTLAADVQDLIEVRENLLRERSQRGLMHAPEIAIAAGPDDRSRRH